MIDIRHTILQAIPRDFWLDAEDRLRADTMSAHTVINQNFTLSAKRSGSLVGQARFRLQEQGFEEVVPHHGGIILTSGVLPETDLKFYQPFARFAGPEVGIILGFASMPEKRRLPPKNMSRATGVTLNVRLQASLFDDEDSPKPTDIFVLLLTSRDRNRAGRIEEIAVGAIDSNYNDFIFYESLDDFLSGYETAPGDPDSPDSPLDGDPIVKLRTTRKPFTPPEKHPNTDVDDSSGN